jgi:Tfp pilus assembly protein PilE
MAGIAVPMYNVYIIKSLRTAVVHYRAALKAEANEYFLRNGRFPHVDGHTNKTLAHDGNVYAYEY